MFVCCNPVSILISLWTLEYQPFFLFFAAEGLHHVAAAPTGCGRDDRGGCGDARAHVTSSPPLWSVSTSHDSTHSQTHTLTHSHTHTNTHTHTHFTLTSPTHTLTYSPNYLLSRTPPHTLTHLPTQPTQPTQPTHGHCTRGIPHIGVIPSRPSHQHRRCHQCRWWCRSGSRAEAGPVSTPPRQKKQKKKACPHTSGTGSGILQTSPDDPIPQCVPDCPL